MKERKIELEFTETQAQMIEAQAAIYGLTPETYLRLLMLNDFANEGVLPPEYEKERRELNAKRDQIDRDRAANSES